MESRTVEKRAQSFWSIEPRYTTVEFLVKNFFFFTVKGKFTDFAGKIELDENNLHNSTVDFVIRAASIHTGIKRRDHHLRSAAFLDVHKFPDIHFQSTKVEKGRDRDTLRVTGALTIMDQSRELVIDVEETDTSRSPQGEEVTYYLVQAKINRFDFGVKKYAGLIGRTLKVAIQAQATKQN
ncbi:MAG: YceI family protein [Acidobacteria bacterium]|nr:YceI family protein [Acidobacteriota bacterium]